MIQLDETTIAMAFAVIGVVSTAVLYGLALYGIKSLQDIRDAIERQESPDGR